LKPIGPLMREHRLIERMVAVMDFQLNQSILGQKVDAAVLFTGVDFFWTYADRTHHGKEEEILFRALAKKTLTPDLSKILRELIQEHIAARQLVGQLAESATRYNRGDQSTLNEIQTTLKELVGFYPVHILKEDQHFFYPIQELFSRDEQDAMLAEFWEFDRRLIHEKYLKIVEENEKIK
jgi:hemerythrin-like domain-containing protein